MKRILFSLAALAISASLAQAQQPCANGLCPAVRAVVSDGLHSLGSFVAPPVVVVGSSATVPQAMPCTSATAGRAHPVIDWWKGRKRLFGGCQ